LTGIIDIITQVRVGPGAAAGWHFLTLGLEDQKKMAKGKSDTARPLVFNFLRIASF